MHSLIATLIFFFFFFCFLIHSLNMEYREKLKMLRSPRHYRLFIYYHLEFYAVLECESSDCRLEAFRIRAKFFSRRYNPTSSLPFHPLHPMVRSVDTDRFARSRANDLSFSCEVRSLVNLRLERQID